MSAGILGGDIGQIQEQAGAYRVLGENLSACGGNVVTTTDGAVAGLQEHLASAQVAVTAALTDVSGESQRVMGQFGGINWTGANRAQVEAVGLELDRQVNDTTARVQEIFEAFRADLGRLGGELTEVAAHFGTAATSAGESAHSISLAMDAQAVQLDEVMNTGITSV
jgi:hypothetical protein